MKAITFFYLVFLTYFYNPLIGQKDSTINSLTSLNTFKTKEDFFKQQKEFYKSYVFYVNWETSPHLGYSVPTYYQFPDTNFYAYEVYAKAFDSRGSLISEGKTKWIKTYKDYYSLFGGGTINAYCILRGFHATYNNDGYAKEVFYSDYYAVSFIDIINKIKTEKIEVFLKSKPEILEKYKKEKDESDKKAWKKNRLEIEMRYLKLFNTAN